MARSPRRLPPLTVVLVLAVAVVAGVSRADAHAILLSTEPAAGDVVDRLDAVRLVFADDLAPVGHLVVVRTAAGAELEATGYEVVDATTLVASFDVDLADGDHEVGWETVAADGHRERGLIPFTMAAGQTAAPAPAGSPTTEQEPVETEPTAALSLVRTSPTAGERLSELNEVRFDFSAELASGGHHQVVLHTEAGAQVVATALELAEPTAMVARFDGDIPDGDHELRWRVEGLDGTTPSGAVPITVAVADARDGGATPLLLGALVAVVAVAVAGLAHRRRRGGHPTAGHHPRSTTNAV